MSKTPKNPLGRAPAGDIAALEIKECWPWWTPGESMHSLFQPEENYGTEERRLI